MNRFNRQLALAMRYALASSVIAIAFAMPAQAQINGNSTGGASCKAAAGPGADVFYFANLFAQNTSESDQYLTCSFTDLSTVGKETPMFTQAYVTNTTSAPATFICVVQAGTDDVGVVNTAVSSIEVPAATTAAFYWNGASTPTIPVRPNPGSAYTLSCRIPSQGKLGAISVRHAIL